MRKIPCVFMRGGACKGAIFHLNDLPEDKNEWDNIFIQIMGSPDPKQVDGLGGGTSSNNKIVIINPSKKKDIDIEYTIGQVIPNKPQVDYKSNCGNMTTTVGPFAVDEGLVKINEPFTSLRLLNTNTKKIVEVNVPVKDGKAVTSGDYVFSGVLGTSAEIPLTFKNPIGTLNKGLFPTGNKIDKLEIPDYGVIDVTIIDAASPLVITRAKDIGIKGTELPDELNKWTEKMELLKKIRGITSLKLGLVQQWQDADDTTPATPKIAFFTEAQSYKSIDKESVEKENMDFCSRIISVGKTHNAYVFTGAIAMAVAAKTQGTIISEALNISHEDTIRIGHPSGVMPVKIEMQEKDNNVEVEGVTLISTARRIMDGFVYCN